ncbi:MAG: hypothetical protein WC565_01190 [Parcubacteria group bacterium]
MRTLIPPNSSSAKKTNVRIVYPLQGPPAARHMRMNVSVPGATQTCFRENTT